MFLFKKIGGNVQFNSLFLENSNNFYLFPRKAGCFFIWGFKVLSVWSSVFFFCFRHAWKESISKTDGIKRVGSSQQGLRFRAWPIHAAFTVHCLMIICKYLSLRHKLDYEPSGLNTYQVVSLFQWFK